MGENIADPTKTFPIKTRAYLVYSGANTEPYIAGQQYTLTMKATKPVTQTFNVFLDAGTIGFGSMTPVEGLTDVWQKTVTVRQDLIDAGVKDRLTIYQVPNSSVGDVQID
ncbi:TPA: BppU family phage baseplate upper protein, partial [Enterococcus faecium]